MKKIFALAIAAVALTVGCQKAQNPVNPETPVDENELVEIKFSTNITTVETKTVTSLEGLKLMVYGQNITTPAKRSFYDEATAGVPDQGVVDLTFADTTYYYNGNNDKYNFYGYYLDGATTIEGADTLSATNQVTTVKINGKNDILLAQADENGTYCGAKARDGENPHLTFRHAMSQLKFGAVNLGGSTLSLSAITVQTDTSGTINVADTLAVAVAGLGDFDLPMTALNLDSFSGTPTESDYEEVTTDGSTESELIIFPGASSNVLTLELKQGSDTRKLQYTMTQTFKAGHSYKLLIKLYSLEEIEITASLTDWTVETIEIDTDSAIEL